MPRPSGASSEATQLPRGEVVDPEPPSECANAQVRFRKISLTATLQRGLQAPGDLPDQIAIDTENTKENQLRKATEQQRSEREALIRQLMEEELRALKPIAKGELAVYWVYVEEEDPDDVARALYLKPGTSTLRVYMWKALHDHPCGASRDHCERVADCAHSRGMRRLFDIVRRILLKLP